MAAVGEDSSRQDMKKKHAVGKDRRRGGHEVPGGFEPRSNNRKSAIQSPAWDHYGYVHLCLRATAVTNKTLTVEAIKNVPGRRGDLGQPFTQHRKNMSK